MTGAPQPWYRRLRSIDRSLWVLFGVVIVSSVGSGMPWYAMGMLFTPFTGEFGWGRGAYSVGTSIFMLCLNLSALPVGHLVDRWGSRRVMGISGVASFVVWLLISQVGRIGQQSALTQLYVLYGLLGVTSAALGQVPSNALVARWFRKRRGLALGIALLGGSLPGVILVPLSAPFIDSYGWRALTLVLGTLALLGSVPVVLWLLREAPPDTDQPVKVGIVRPADDTARTVLRTGGFWITALAFALGMMSSVAIQMHAIPFLTDRGLSRAMASSIWGFLALWGMVGKVVLGWAADRFSARLIYSASLLMQAVAVLVAFSSGSPIAAWAFATLFGLGMGGQNCTRATIVAEQWGLRAYGAIMGLMLFITVPANVGGGPLAGYLYDLTGNYHVPYTIFMGCFALGAGALWLLRRPKDAAVAASA